jgi:A/G-specific adenine glycosylase
MPLASDYPKLRRQLLNWFRKNARALPWRATRDPYAIWISEVMLQQTQVATVIPYFQRFLARLPDVQSLAEADEQEVLRLWEGLGYYRRARDLCRAARQLAENGHTSIPDDPEFVRSLSGFGRYTTNAVLSQAYDRRVPIVEANSQRVLCRLFGIEQNPKENATQKQLWQLADDLLPTKSVGDFNQALMEFGALVCGVKPSCESCPIAALCQARRQNRQHELPRRAEPPKVVAVSEVAVIVHRDKRVLLVQRPDGGRWERMWEFPHHELAEGESNEAAAHRLLDSLNLRGNPGAAIATISHSVTRFRITMTCFQVNNVNGRAKSDQLHDVAWVAIDDLPQYPLAAAQRRIARLLTSDSGSNRGIRKSRTK